MCGIVGYVSRDERASARTPELARAVEVLRHRGPDDRGIWTAPDVGLGHTRLSILDLSARGHQPMRGAGGHLVVVYNGEVYNFPALRTELESLGHAFAGCGDTEVILAAFLEWGSVAVERFIGMFAIALWDTRDRSMRLFRDRLGVKPLYWGWDGSTLMFGSELKALRELRHWTPQIDRRSLGEFFQYGTICHPRTIYQGVHALEPGHWLELSARREPAIHRYWSLPEDEARAVPSEDELVDECEALMRSAFEYRMVSDVPVGVFLSGGLDSSLVTAVLQRNADRPLRTFTIGFARAAFDESAHARAIAHHLKTDHTERTMEPRDALAIVERWGDLYDEPFGDASGIPTYLVSKIAREHVTVALSADGGDELFGGYGSYATLPARHAKLQRLPGALRRAAALAAGPLSRRVVQRALALAPGGGSPKALDRIMKLRAALADPSFARFFELSWSVFLEDEAARLVGIEPARRGRLDGYPGAPPERMMRWDLEHYLPADILTKVDRASMAVGLETREPLLDHRLVELAFRLPLNQRLGALGSKHLLRRVLYRYLPRELVDRPKQGFGIPLFEWLRDELAPLVDEHLSVDRVARTGVLDPDLVRDAVGELRQGTNVDPTRVWLLLAFALWHERWMR